MAAGRILIEKNVEVQMRDGVKTYADVYRPDVGEPVPAVVTRTPYNKEPAVGGLPVMPGPLPLAQEGYAVVVADTRGRFSSEGAFEPFADEELDGYDTIEWAAAQPWCDGGTAVYGPSYIGATTMLAAKSRPPSLRCAIPIITPHDYFDAWVYQGGAFQLGFSTWWGQMLAQTNLLRADHGVADEHADELLAAAFAGMEPFRARPLSQMPGLAAPEVAPYWQRWLEHDRRDDYWNGTSLSGNDFSDLDIPMFHVSGWFDIFGLGSFRNFTGMQHAGASQQRLWVGPWSHVYYDRYLGELDFGVLGAGQACGIQLEFPKFLAQHLRGEEQAAAAAVHYFLMGANEWRDAEAWPPPEASERVLHLHSGGAANSARGDGVLDEARPSAGERPDRYLYDPERPVPTDGGATLQGSVTLPGPRDQRAIEARDDVLCYTTAPLEQPLTVAGPVTVELWAASDAEDTDWTAKLVDVHPDGRAVSLCDSIIRARFRNSFSEPEPLRPGEPACYNIDLSSTAHRFGAGHRVRLEISSSNFPRFDAHPNLWGELWRMTESRPAVQQVLHEEAHPSTLRLWTLPE